MFLLTLALYINTPFFAQNEKVNFLHRVSSSNPFGSDFFSWLDIGFFRSPDFRDAPLLNAVPGPPKLNTGQVMMLDCR